MSNSKFFADESPFLQSESLFAEQEVEPEQDFRQMETPWSEFDTPRPTKTSGVQSFCAKTLPMRVATFVSSAAKDAIQKGSAVEVLVFAHGLDACDPPKAGSTCLPEKFVSNDPFRLGEVVEASKRPIMLVVPHLAWSSVKYFHPLGQPKNLNGIVAEALDAVGATSLSRLIVAGHSRAWGVLNALAQNHASSEMSARALRSLTHVWALDTTYGTSVSDWNAWLEARSDLNVTVVFIPHSKTSAGGVKFQQLRNDRLAVVESSARHCDVPHKHLPDLLQSLSGAVERERLVEEMEVDEREEEEPIAEEEWEAESEDEEAEEAPIQDDEEVEDEFHDFGEEALADAEDRGFEETRVAELFEAGEDEEKEEIVENQIVAGQPFLPLRGKVVIGDESSSVITADRIDLWVSTRDVDPPASAVSIVPGTNPDGAPQTSLQIAVGAPTFSLLIPGDAFDGFLIVRATWNHPRSGGSQKITRTARLPLQLAAAAALPYRVVVMHPTANAQYLWTAPELVRSDASAARAGRGNLTIQIRDQVHHKTHYRAVFALGSGGRAKVDGENDVVFGVPVSAPALLRVAAGDPGAMISLASTGFPAGTYLPRAELKTFSIASRTHPAVPCQINVTTAASNLLAGRSVVLDPGHGVNYELPKQARVYEWYVAHRVVSAAKRLLQALGASVVIVPTARFQLANVNLAVSVAGLQPADTLYKAPHARLHIDRTRTPHRFELEVVGAALTLPSLAAALGYDESSTRDPFFKAYKQRAQFFAEYPALFKTLVDRAKIPAGFTPVAQSLAWSESAKQYQITVEGTSQGKTVQKKINLALKNADRFDLLADEVRWLATASIVRSYRNEMGAPYRAVIGAMNTKEPSEDVVKYAVDVLTKEAGRSLTPGGRVAFMRNQTADAYVTCHHNAGGGDGISVLIPTGTTAKSARGRAAKRFLKYLDPLNKGKHGSGLKFSPASLVTQAPSTGYVYLEVDFMDARDAAARGSIRYGRMVDDAQFIRPAAEQIAAAVIESIVSPQSDNELDAADIGTPD